jgi:hypothetical protein
MAWAIVAGAAISVVGGAVSGGKSSKANQASAAADEAQLEQARLTGIQADMAEEGWERYKEIYEPMERQFVDESRNLGSIANQNQTAQQAAADVASGFAGVREQLAETPGMQPNSQAYLQEANRINLAEAATSAAAQTGARQQTRDRGRAAVTDVISLGKGLPGSSSSMLASAGSGLNSAARFYADQEREATRRSDAGVNAAGRMVGGITGSKAFQDWANGPTAPAGGNGNGGYTSDGTTYNNPSSYVAPDFDAGLLPGQ